MHQSSPYILRGERKKTDNRKQEFLPEHRLVKRREKKTGKKELYKEKERNKQTKVKQNGKNK